MRPSLLPAGLLFASSALLLAACSESSPPPASNPVAETAHQYDTEIRWTSYGIPHVKADDWGSLGYGFAYATANDAICTIARDVLMVNGELSATFGEENGNYESDVFHRAVLDEAMIERFRSGQEERTLEFSAGYVAGYNRYLADNADDLPTACAGADWVRTLTERDVDKLTVGVGIRYGLGLFQREMANAAPPGNPVARLQSDFDIETGIGSNAVAMGRDVTETGSGILLGNPHYPWQGSSRFHMIHTTIPGEVDVMGVSLYTTNRIAIGFNHDVAWSHTVSTGMRSTVYALELDPENPTRYRYGDDFRDMERVSIEVPVRNIEGGISQRSHDVYMTHFGPVLVSDQLPWTNESAYAIRDVNLYNDRMAATYDALNKARNIDEVEAALSLQGVSWVNTIAADRDGTAFYADISVVPNVDADLIGRCRVTTEGVPARVVILDGSDPDCEWYDAAESEVPGAMPAGNMPRIRRDDYVHNANDSYWLSTPREPLEGYSPIIGSERSQVSLRTRAGLVFIEQALASGEKMRPDHIQDMLFSHRHFGAELFLDEVLALCSSNNETVTFENEEIDVTPACSALADWDRREDIDSRGAHVWREFWRQAARISDRYVVPFDVEDPVNTPRQLATDNPEVREGLLQALAHSQTFWQQQGIALDAELGTLQYEPRNDERIPIPGGDGGAGMWSVITSQFNAEQQAYSPILHGNSYMQVISWDQDGRVDPRAILSYSQSEDPRSPHFADQTRLYSQSQWLELPFYEEDILADPNLLSLRLQE
ncbi:penicillin acylase family protein [Pseudohongiella spirulinae]|uniref:Aculeacin A acylase n=1 Tax=Pseudohongiella spirulinae TaxID=1249552 RepID=A0A0S2KAA3_9GAMM|nr:penicillin acylase family protein [Pseudohongiella spirulinae]ALO45281.1 Aculeacin A acylase [Pseudohongiella spirulinae]